MDYPCVRKALKVACRYTRKKELPPPVSPLFYLMPLSFSLSLRSQLLSVPTSGSTPADLTTIADTTPFTLMFGPDKYIFSEYIVFGRFICMRVCACVCARVCVCVCVNVCVSLQMSVCVRVCESKSTPCQPQTGFLFLLLEKNPLLLCRCGADAKLHFIFRHQSPITLVQCVLMCTLFIHLLLLHHHPLYHLLLLLLTIILKWTV